MCNIFVLLHIGTKTEVIVWYRWAPLAHLKLIKLHTSGTCRGMHWITVLGQSTQLSKHTLVTSWYMFAFKFNWGIPLFFSKGEGKGHRSIQGYCRCRYVDISQYRLLPHKSLVSPSSLPPGTPPANGGWGGSAPPPLRCLWETLRVIHTPICLRG